MAIRALMRETPSPYYADIDTRVIMTGKVRKCHVGANGVNRNGQFIDRRKLVRSYRADFRLLPGTTGMK